MSQTKMSKGRLHNYNVGYKHGFSGKELNQEFAKTYPGYFDGWHDGWSDMPSLEERIGIDIRKERSTACLD